MFSFSFEKKGKKVRNIRTYEKYWKENHEISKYQKNQEKTPSFMDDPVVIGGETPKNA